MSDPDARRRASLEHWDEVAPAWDEAQVALREATAPVSRWMIEALELEPGQTVLELAAGPGETGFIAARRVAPSGGLISSDNSDAMLAIARARAVELGLDNVEFRVINAESIDLPVASVDAVLCRWGYELMVDPMAAFVETRRVLKPGGRVALAVDGDGAWLRSQLEEAGFAEIALEALEADPVGLEIPERSLVAVASA